MMMAFALGQKEGVLKEVDRGRRIAKNVIPNPGWMRGTSRKRGSRLLGEKWKRARIGLFYHIHLVAGLHLHHDVNEARLRYDAAWMSRQDEVQSDERAPITVVLLQRVGTRHPLRLEDEYQTVAVPIMLWAPKVVSVIAKGEAADHCELHVQSCDSQLD